MSQNRKILLGADIGGTKCAASLGVYDGETITISAKSAFATAGSPESVLERLAREMQKLVVDQYLSMQNVAAVGVSCGGPLDSRRGLVLGPPNLPGWDRVPVVQILSDLTHRPTFIENDANACALAEWRWGAGKCRDMIFLTFGTGMGGGLILNNQLYRGACDLAGEVGHMRLSDDGPEGYGKRGSFEGHCSGGGIFRAARLAGLNSIQSAQDVFSRASAGDAECLKVVEQSARQLGRGLAILLDLFNPQKVVIGSIFVRQEKLLRPWMEEELRREALPAVVEACEIVPAALGESIGDYAALAVAQNGSEM